MTTSTAGKRTLSSAKQDEFSTQLEDVNNER